MELSQSEQARKNRSLAFTVGKIGAGIITPFAPYVGLPLYAGLTAAETLTDEKKKKAYNATSLGKDVIDMGLQVGTMGVGGAAGSALKPLAKAGIQAGMRTAGNIGKDLLTYGDKYNAKNLLYTGINTAEDFGMNSLPGLVAPKMNMPKGVQAPDMGFGELPQASNGILVPNREKYGHENETEGTPVLLDKGEIAIPKHDLDNIFAEGTLEGIGKKFVEVVNKIKAKGIPNNNMAASGAFNDGEPPYKPEHFLMQYPNSEYEYTKSESPFIKNLNESLKGTISIPVSIPESAPITKPPIFTDEQTLTTGTEINGLRNSLLFNPYTGERNKDVEYKSSVETQGEDSLLEDYWKSLEKAEKWNTGLNIAKGALSAGLLARAALRKPSKDAKYTPVARQRLEDPSTAIKAATTQAANRTYSSLLENTKRTGAPYVSGALAGTLFDQYRKANTDAALASNDIKNKQAAMDLQTDMANAQAAAQTEQFNIQRKIKEDLGITEEMASAITGMFKSANDYQNFKMAIDQRKITGQMLENILKKNPKDGWEKIFQLVNGQFQLENNQSE